MRVPVEWLADYVDLEMSIEELADRLTMTGLKVESIDRLGANWQDVVIGQIVEARPHPSPKLKKPMTVTTVHIGRDGLLTIVTGAPNASLHDKVAVVPVGGILPHGPDGNPLEIDARPIFGIASQGMLASERELGISDEHTGILVLSDDSPIGQPLRSMLGGDVLDIETNPNRPDTLSIIGIAREVAAITEQQLRMTNLDALPQYVQSIDEESIPVTVEASDLCPRYSALRVENVPGGPSPSWMARRLEAAGMRPINLVVDITNYVMLELGQPMHAFDAARLRGPRIIVRRAHLGEQIRTLDGEVRDLSPNNMVIADAERAVAIAGVMGGEDSEIADGTSAVVLESATFDPASVRKTAQALGLRTESSSRFEKGLPLEQTVPAAYRFVQLLSKASSSPLRVARLSDSQQTAPERRTVSMPMRDLHRLVGLEISRETAAEKLSLLGFNVDVQADRLVAEVPFWRRVDVERSSDLVEEVVRLVGYDAVPSTLPRRTMEPPPPAPELRWEAAMREALLSAGVSEVTTHALTSSDAMARLSSQSCGDEEPGDMWARLVPNAAGVYGKEALTAPVPLLNPATQDRQVLRLTLLPGVLDAMARNMKQTDEELAFFELDRTFFSRRQDLPYERRTLAIALSGTREPVSWQIPRPQPYSFYDIKGILQLILRTLQIGDWSARPLSHPALHPGRAAGAYVGGHEIAYLGELHPRVASSFDVERWPVQVAEIDLDALFVSASDIHVFRPLPRYPAARRDIAVLVHRDIPAGEIMRIVRAVGGDLLEDARIFDVYEGERLPDDMKSVAVSMELRTPGGTLTQEEVADTVERIVQSLAERLGARLRE